MLLRQRYSRVVWRAYHDQDRVVISRRGSSPCGLCAVPAHALPTRTWVSGKGTDAGACTVTAPCRTFAFALTQTNAGGEIDVLDPAGYGAVTIAKAINIVNDDVGVAGIQTAPGANGVTINAGANDSVHLRGLTIEGLGSGAAGIQFNTGGNLAIENCVIRNFRIAGINISPHHNEHFSVSNTIASNNPGDGILVQLTGRRSLPASSAKSPRTIITSESS
jgi:hypothetical protein